MGSRRMAAFGEFCDRTLRWLVAFLVVSAAYLYTFPQPHLFYAGVVLLHAAGRVLAAILLTPVLFRRLRAGSISSRLGWLLTAVGAVAGLILIKTGTPRTEWNKLYLHIIISLAGIGLLFARLERPILIREASPARPKPGAGFRAQCRLPRGSRRCRIRCSFHPPELAVAQPY